VSLIARKDVSLLLDAGFSPEDLGLVEGGMQGVEIYESPNDYFAKELIENACEQGLCSLMNEILPPDDRHLKERYDDSRKGLYDDQEYDGGIDPMEDVPVECRDQVEWLKSIKLGKMTIWQRRNKKGDFEWMVKNLKVTIPEDDLDRFNKLSKEDQKILWSTYAKDEWKNAWEQCAYSLRRGLIDGLTTFRTNKGITLNLLVIPADNLREQGYNNLPPEARWITMVFFYKDDMR
jgi:hypothetical protein